VGVELDDSLTLVGGELGGFGLGGRLACFLFLYSSVDMTCVTYTQRAEIEGCDIVLLQNTCS
jgi:hypothetical protein